MPDKADFAFRAIQIAFVFQDLGVCPNLPQLLAGEQLHDHGRLSNHESRMDRRLHISVRTIYEHICSHT